MAYDIKQSSTQSALLFFLVQSADHITGLTGASPTVTLSKNGAAFASPAGAVTEISSGWYKVAGNATDTGTLGPLALHATAASADPCDLLVANIVAYDPQNATTLGLTNLDAAISTRLASASYTAPSNLTAGQIATGVWQDTTASDFTTALSVGKSLMNGGSLGTGLTIVSVSGSVGSVTAGVTVSTNNDKTGYTASTVSDKTGYSLSASGIGAIYTTAMTESYAGQGVVPTLAQILFETRALQAEKAVSGTTLTAKKIDGSTTAATYTLNDAVAPSAITRAT